jgi:succinate dehydrogenase/fumarate reductase cytochrome b subunit
MLQNSPRKSSQKYLDQLQNVLQSPLMSVVYFISAIVCLFGGHGFLALMMFVSCVYSNPILVWKAQNQYRSVLQRYRLNVVMLTGVLFGLLSGVVLGLSFVEPSHAQFFNNAQVFIQTTFKGSGLTDGTAGGIIGLVMNTLRLLFVMYVLFGIVQVFQAVRQGEEWKDLAKTPFFVVLAGTLGDVLVGAIVGPGGTTP